MKEMFKIAGTFPYLIALFLNAFTDLGHKIIIQNTIFMVYDEQTQIILTAVVNALVLLPYLFLFTPVGFVSDRFPKNLVMRHAALIAVFLTLGITLAYYQGWFFTAFSLTFLMAIQSAFYAPAKYGYIKELVGNKFISAGNAAVQSGTTVAILAGIIVYTVLFELRLGDTAPADKAQILKSIAPLGWLLVIGSVVEWLLTFRLPLRTQARSQRRFELKKYFNGTYLHRNMKLMTRKREIFVSVLALSVYWGVAQVVLAVFGAYAKMHLGAQSVIAVQGVMVLAGVGIVIGSVNAARFSRYFIHLGMVPFGMAGMASMLLLIPLVPNLGATAPLFFLFGWFAGFFIVPLNAYIQRHAPNVHLGTILAGNNYIQTIFMVGGLALTTLFAWFGMDASMLLWLMAALAVATAVYLVKHHLILFFWFITTFLFSFRYKLEFIGEEHIPPRGPVLLLGNHISWIDWILVQIPIERRLRYIMERRIYEWRFSNWLMRLGRTIPISQKAPKSAFVAGKHELDSGGALVIFPEGGISDGGELGKFYRGFEIITAGKEEGVIVPFFIDDLYGSLFSRSVKRFVPRRSLLFRRVVTVRYGEPMGLQSSAEEVRRAVEHQRDLLHAE